jgi:hypothetical protein
MACDAKDEKDAEVSDTCENPEFRYDTQLSTICVLLESMNRPRPEDSYNYPVYPGMPEWANLKDRGAAFQIPVDTLKKMSTQAVVQAIWEHYNLLFVVHRCEYQGDFEFTFLQNDAYIELSSRADAGKCLLQRLVLVNPLTPNASWMSNVLEVLISQPIFLSQLNDSEKKTVIEAVLKNVDLRQTGKIVLYKSTSWLLIGKTMLNANYVPFVEEENTNEQLKSFFEAKFYASYEGGFNEIPTLLIMNYVNDFLNEH